MKKHLFTIALLLCISVCLSADEPQQGNDWIAASVKAKFDLQSILKSANMPVVSKLMQRGDDAQPFVVDLKGVDKLILITYGGSDGSGHDHSVWANARLVRADGSFDWLDATPYEYGVAGWNKPRMNINAYDQKIKINGKEYAHGVFCHADGTLIYPINGKYVRFEAEVGIDDGTHKATVYFQALNTSPTPVANKLASKYPHQIGKLSAVMNGLDEWLITNNATKEQQAVEDVINQLNDGSYFKNKIKEIDKESDLKKKISSYLALFEQVDNVLTLQNSLKSFNFTSLTLAYSDMKKLSGFDVEKNQALYDQVMELQNKDFSGIYKYDVKAVADLTKMLEASRTILLNNPMLDVDRIVATSFNLGSNARSAMAPSMGTQANNWSNQQSASRGGFDAEIIELNNIRAETPSIRRIFKPKADESITDLRMHWNADRLMFTSIMPDKRWNVFEVNIDGSSYKPLVETVEKDLEFFDGTYLPDGRVIATSNIGYQGVPCVDGEDPVGNMVLYDPATKNLRRLTFDQDANWNPTVMPNGRVMYTRWEYTDLMHYYSRMVMHMNPDGTENKALYGSGSMFPNSTFDMHTLPGHSTAFVAIISGHHGIARSGRLVLVDPMKARKGAEGMTHEIPHSNRKIVEIVKDEMVNGVWPQFIKPFPINDKYFLVSAKLEENGLWGIYLVDVFDNMTLIKEDPGKGYISPILVKKQTVPPTIPDRVKLGDKEATVFIQDIYEGEGLRGVPRGTVKALRVFTYEYAYVNSPSNHMAQGIQSGWDLKRLLGTVAVEQDGSAIFKVPANTPISLQPLDADGTAIQWMRSWFTAMPSEIVSCVGCHEDQNNIVMPKRVTASQKAPMKLTKPEDGTRSFTFELEVQPILDRACIVCHNGYNGSMDLRGDRRDEMGYSKSYLAIHPFVHRQGPEADMQVLQPYEYHVSTSELVRLIKKDHHNVKLTDKEWQSLYNWIDFNAPDKGYFLANKYNGISEKGIDQVKRRQELGIKYADGVSVDWQAELKSYAETLKNRGEITPVMPEKEKPVAQPNVNAKGWPFDADRIKAMLAGEKSTRKIVEIAPGLQLTFVRIPAGEFIMGSTTQGSKDNMPASKVKINKPFWLGEVEITNAQYAALVPEHDSRYVDQFWKDHVNAGYPANLPDQPVIRVSYKDAMEYCSKLSDKTGLNITLPTEAQWEWACRAGSDTDFWYGDLNSDFGTKENLADVNLSKMAVSGIDPQPMHETNYWYKYLNFVPKQESVNDNSMIQTNSKNYHSNPFGLYSMHGNIAEWTRSTYQSYPYTEKVKQPSDLKVVRGGSYWERPKFSTSYVRKAYYDWQRNNLVGFRVIIED